MLWCAQIPALFVIATEECGREKNDCQTQSGLLFSSTLSFMIRFFSACKKTSAVAAGGLPGSDGVDVLLLSRVDRHLVQRCRRALGADLVVPVQAVKIFVGRCGRIALFRVEIITVTGVYLVDGQLAGLVGGVCFQPAKHRIQFFHRDGLGPAVREQEVPRRGSASQR